MRRLTLFFLFPLLSLGANASKVTFLSYNIKNFLEREIIRGGEVISKKYKPEKEIRELVSIIQSQNPDILGICEIGTKEDLNKLRTRLKSSGLNYPYIKHHTAADSVRNLALLSKFPIIEDQSQSALTYQIGTLAFPFRRGILHLTLDIHGTPIHLVGIHLKSKRPTQEADQAVMRLKEAILTRKHIDHILTKNPVAKLILYGDFNDTYQSPPLHALKGIYRSPSALIPLQPKDSRGEYWTHYWKWQREYNVFDYVLYSQSMKHLIQTKQSHIIDSPNVLKASDHRPILVTIDLIQN